MKIIAYYLPQFHEIEENNKWWGKGFTEWTNVKKAKPLYKGHIQPKIPLNSNYYNLMDKKVMEWQTDLMKKYNVYGLCYYHYYFEGKMLLEKPAENLLKWKDINQKFCFCWANHDWRKTWNGTSELLMKQTYRAEDSWKEHFYYLLKFFKDERYIKIENKPVFVIYKTEDIENCEKMLEYWNKLAKENNLDGLYVIETIDYTSGKNNCENSNAVLYREPAIALSKLRKRSKIEKILDKVFNKEKEKPERIDYDLVWKKILEFPLKKKENKQRYLGTFSSWDNTSRHGENGFVIENGNPEKFKKYLLEQKKQMKNENTEYIFLNAWNEWAEGMYIEPDEENKYGYLEAIKEVMDTEV